LSAAERRYAVSGRSRTRAVILAATRGDALNGLTATRPKVMLPIGGKPILRRLVEELKKQAVNEITVVAGYRAEAIDTAGISLVLNPDYQDSGELASLSRAESCFGEDAVILYGDLLFRNYILRDLLDSDAGIVAVVDSHASVGGASDYAYCTQPDARSLMSEDAYLKRVTADPASGARRPSGRWIGMWRAQGEGCRAVKKGLADLRARADFSRLNTPHLLNHLVRSGHKVHVLYIHGHWLDVNTLEDLDRAGLFAEGRH
ncbi:MAG: NTP transferase domain-containing protein, partial [Gammaproteobacteria bacterium]